MNVEAGPWEKWNRIGIVGGGPTGLGILIGLRDAMARGDLAAEKTIIELFEPSGRPGAGLAFSSYWAQATLNTRAETMGLHLTRPRDLDLWRADRGGDTTDQHPARSEAGASFQDTARTAIRDIAKMGGIVRCHPYEILQCRETSAGVELRSYAARHLVDHVFLSLGHLPSTRFSQLARHPKFIGSPWMSGALEAIPPNDAVLIAGTSLSAMDIAHRLGATGHTGPIHAVSRTRGLPMVQYHGAEHEAQGVVYANLSAISGNFTRKISLHEAWELLCIDLDMNPASMLQLVRERVALARSDPAATLALVIDEARNGHAAWYPALSSIWAQLPLLWEILKDDDRVRFLRDYESTWAMFMHSMTLSKAEAIMTMMDAGQLRVRTGVCDIQADPKTAGFRFTMTDSNGDISTQQASWMVDGTGPESQLEKLHCPLTDQMVADGFMRPHPLGGVDVDSRTMRLIHANGSPSEMSHFVGPLTKGVHFATTSFRTNTIHAVLAVNDYVNQIFPRR